MTNSSSINQPSIKWGDTIRNPLHREGDNQMRFNVMTSNLPFFLDKWGPRRSR
jgi:type I restriction enzyme M protein